MNANRFTLQLDEERELVAYVSRNPREGTATVTIHTLTPQPESWVVSGGCGCHTGKMIGPTITQATVPSRGAAESARAMLVQAAKR